MSLNGVDVRVMISSVMANVAMVIWQVRLSMRLSLMTL
jgi:hypothetical protein